MGTPDGKAGYKSQDAAAQDVAPTSPQRSSDGPTAAAGEEAQSGSVYKKQQDMIAAIGMNDPATWEQIRLEKSRYPGASTWAKDEERLFELLFLREDLPILPTHWDLDLRAVPISHANFEDEQYGPFIYAHSKDHIATTALVRLIELTASVRTASESGLRCRISNLIKDALDKYLAWAAEDGGYSHLRVVPNIITEVIDTEAHGHDIAALMQGRMRAFGRLQREFYREDRDASFWDVSGALDLTPSKAWVARDVADDEEDRTMKTTVDDLLLQKYLSPRKKHNARKRKRTRRRHRSSTSAEDELATDIKMESPELSSSVLKRHRTFASPVSEIDDLAKPMDAMQMPSTPGSERRESRGIFSSPSTPATDVSSPAAASPVRYRRRLPVVYGFFILQSTVFILTVDPAQGDRAYVSFHVEADFMDVGQSVWNALTVGIVACMARDELRLRRDDFEERDDGEESDPDV